VKETQRAASMQADIDAVLSRIRAQMDLDSDAEREVLAEIRDHLEQAVAEAKAAEGDESVALERAAAQLGVDVEVGRALQSAHAGWGTADAVLAAGLPVVCALVLRWLVFAPDGSALGWPELLVRPAFWIVALAALLVPLLKWERWRYALAGWAVFWALTVVFSVWPTLHW
jgi:hypothetical protein